MHKRYLVGSMAAGVMLAGGVSFAVASSSGSGVTVKTMDGQKYAINRYAQEDLRFVPGTVKVKSGSTLTFTFGDREQETHTLTIVSRARLPRTNAQINNCRSCQIAVGHLKNPKNQATALTPANPIIHWTLNKGEPGLDIVGDSLAIQSGGAHKRNTAVVSAPAGRVLYFLCAIHPWMQGKIIVQ